MHILEKMSQETWKYRKYFLSLHRQEVILGYPGRIPRGVSLHRPCSI